MPAPPDDAPLDTFIALLGAAIDAASLTRLVLAKPRAGHAADLRKVTARPIRVKDQPVLSFVQSHPTRDITKNLAAPTALAAVRDWLATDFAHAHLFTTSGETQWLLGKRGRQTLLRGRHHDAAPAPAAHDRTKHRALALDRPFLAELGITDAQHRLIPAMARKWKQINAFVEVLDHALDAAGLKADRGDRRIEVLDFGSGKGYLTFATHDHLRHGLGLPARVTGVELRPELVALCNGVAQRVGADGLVFEEGDVGSRPPQPADVMIALHACDTATDHAIATGVVAGAAVIVCAPCCHKELRPQLLAPHPLRPLLKHGVHLGQQAEMLTDGLRAMLLEASGYETQVFEFVSLEHTGKNKMILALRRRDGPPSHPPAEAWQQVDELKRFYGIERQCLETLLRSRVAA